MNIIDKGKIIFLITDKTGNIIKINNYGCVVLGASSTLELRGQNIQKFYAHPIDRSYYLEKLEKEGFIKDFEIRFNKKDNGIITCLENAVMNGQSIESLIIDISDFVKNNIETIKLNIQLSDINKKLKDAYNTMAHQEKLASIGELAAGVAHEINNPLGFIMSNFKSLERYVEKIHAIFIDKKILEMTFKNNDLDFVFSDLKDILQENNDGLKRIARITESLKQFSRMDSESRTDMYDLNQAILDTLIIANSHYKYLADIEKYLGKVPLFRCYGNSINQVILNLIINASQAIGLNSNRLKGVIKIYTSLEKDFVVFRISDNGAGVPDNLVRKIFDPFFTTKEVGKGTGLGLSLSYDIIVNKHSGALWCEKNTDGGADFVFKIPLMNENG